MCDQPGRLDVITGPMYAGKTTELLRRLNREALIRSKVIYIKHCSDTRSSGPYSTHNPFHNEKSKKSNITFYSFETLTGIDPLIEENDVIGVDEAQFFDDLFVNVLKWVEMYNKHVIVAGINADCKRKSFDSILKLEPYSDTFIKLMSLCGICAEKKIRRPALFTHKYSGSESRVEIGGVDKYIPVCRSCYHKVNE